MKVQNTNPVKLHPITVTNGEALFFDPTTLHIYASRSGEKPKGVGVPAEIRAVTKRHSSDQPNNIHHHLTSRPRPHLARLTLHVSNKCNLRCMYCYASGGDYQLGQSVMDSSNAVELLSRALQAFDIETLMFFGGEPSINEDVIIDICLFLEEMHRRGFISRLPTLGLISNFYSISNTFLAACKRFNVNMTASIDGPPEVHNKNRPTLSGRGSYSKVRNNILKAKQVGINVNIECTYTLNHIEHGMTVVDLMKFFHTEFGIGHTHIVPVTNTQNSSGMLPLEQTVELFCEAIEYMVSKLGSQELLSLLIGQELIEAIIEREPIIQFCPTGQTELAISPEGDLFPCFIFVGHEELNMGKLDGGSWLTDRGQQILNRIWQNSKDSHPLCCQCWAKNVCSRCIGADYLESGSLETRPSCALVMGTVAETIVRLAEVSQGLPIGHYGKEHRNAYLRQVWQDTLTNKTLL